MKEDWWSWAIIALLVFLLLLLLLSLLLSLLKKRAQEEDKSDQESWDDWGEDGEGGSESEEESGESDSFGDSERYYPTPEELRAKQVQKVLESGDSDVIDLMRREAGLAGGELSDRSQEAALVNRLARSLRDIDVEVLKRAANQEEVDFDLRSTTERLPVNYPTHDIEPTMIEDLDQLPEASYEDIISDDFFERAAMGDLTVMQSYESRNLKKLVYILMDVSMSMEEKMRDGSPRHIWSRAIGVSLMLDAVKGNAKYFLRFFSAAPYELQSATTRDEALQVSLIIQRTGLSPAGTDIPRALATAINDIRTQGGEIAQSEILLISDGEDEKLDIGWLRRALGSDIRLHVLLIGSRSNLLKGVASSYKEIS